MVASAQWVEEASRAIDVGDYDRATSLLERAISVEPNNGRAFYYYGLAMGERGRPGAALSLLQKAEILLQGDARALGEVYAQMGTNLERLGRRQEAVRRYEQALGQDPSNALARRRDTGTARVAVLPSALCKAARLPELMRGLHKILMRAATASRCLIFRPACPEALVFTVEDVLSKRHKAGRIVDRLVSTHSNAAFRILGTMLVVVDRRLIINVVHSLVKNYRRPAEGAIAEKAMGEVYATVVEGIPWIRNAVLVETLVRRCLSGRSRAKYLAASV